VLILLCDGNTIAVCMLSNRCSQEDACVSHAVVADSMHHVLIPVCGKAVRRVFVDDVVI
jgi:hypothetical protein